VLLRPVLRELDNRIEAQLTGLRCIALDATDHPAQAPRGRMIRCCIAWRNCNAHDQRLGTVVDRANVA
jgi:hypothetical protein